MRDFLFRAAQFFYPALLDLPKSERQPAAGYVMRALLFTPPSLIGLVWLVAWTDLRVIRDHWLLVLALFAFMIVLSQLWLEIYYVTADGGYRSDRRSFWGEALWSGVLILGPTVGWLGVLLPWMNFAVRRGKSKTVQRLRVFSQSIFRTSVLLPTLIEVAVYRALGGSFPLPGLDWASVLPAIIATLVGFSAGSLMIGVSIAISRAMSPPSTSQHAPSPPRFFWLMTLIGPLAGLVTILPAGLYTMVGPGAYFAMLFVLLGAALLVDGLSRSAETARQRTREMALLEVLAQAVLQSPPDGSALPDLLYEHIPALFPLCEVAIRLKPDRMLLTHPGGWSGTDPHMWAWEPDRTLPKVFDPRSVRPWVASGRRCGTLIVPIVEAQGERAIGRMVIERTTQGRHVARLLPAAQSLAAQIASALYSADAYQKSVEERIARERGERELALGARVQTSFLPREVPKMDGWQIAAELDPARETSGDFYDFIPLQGGRLGIVIADVADKGLGAAFHMALGVTLMRSTLGEIASRYPRSTLRQMPELVRRINARLIGDSTIETFITAFFGILDAKTSTLHYINAGHNPPYVFRTDRRRRIRELRPTGVALGIFEEYRWRRRSVKLHPGDLLVLYTDGLTDAEDSVRTPFGEGRLQNVVRDNLGQPVRRLSDAVMGSVYDFRGDAAQFDDITLVLVRREG